MNETITEDTPAAQEIIGAFQREIGVTSVPYSMRTAGDRRFIKFQVGRDAPLYARALRDAQHSISTENPFRGTVGLEIVSTYQPFPATLEAGALLTLLTRSTREVAEGGISKGYRVPYIPFQNREDQLLAQPASHIVRGRRGVGKSTLIGRAVSNIRASKGLPLVLDVQAYSALSGEALAREVLQDVCRGVAALAMSDDGQELVKVSNQIGEGSLSVANAPAAIKRALSKITTAARAEAFLFLDDFHLIDFESQPELLHLLHGAFKGAGGWIKVAGISSLMNTYSPKTRKGLQVPGDAQVISLDLTLENPEAAERHLEAILTSFLKAVGYSFTQSVVPRAAFKRLVWATAGVPRDFLQMFGRAVGHAQRNKHSTVTLSDVNLVIGEFGQQKMDDLLQDARNEADELQQFLNKIESVCLDQKKVNAFLVESGNSKIRSLVRALSDLRMVHLIHSSITPDRAGRRYEAYIIDYSMFTGFRRRPGVREMVPSEAQFKASELRALPKIT